MNKSARYSLRNKRKYNNGTSPDSSNNNNNNNNSRTISTDELESLSGTAIPTSNEAKYPNDSPNDSNSDSDSDSPFNILKGAEIRPFASIEHLYNAPGTGIKAGESIYLDVAYEYWDGRFGKQPSYHVENNSTIFTKTYYYGSQILSDIKLIYTIATEVEHIKIVVEYKVHKSILALHSDWFRAILEDPNNLNITELKLPENLLNPITNRIVAPRHLQFVLQCLYENRTLKMEGIIRESGVDFAHCAFLFHYFKCVQKGIDIHCMILYIQDFIDDVNGRTSFRIYPQFVWCELWSMVLCVETFQYDNYLRDRLVATIAKDFVKFCAGKFTNPEYEKYWPKLSDALRITILEKSITNYHPKINGGKNRNNDVDYKDQMNLEQSLLDSAPPNNNNINNINSNELSGLDDDANASALLLQNADPFPWYNKHNNNNNNNNDNNSKYLDIARLYHDKKEFGKPSLVDNIITFKNKHINSSFNEPDKFSNLTLVYTIVTEDKKFKLVSEYKVDKFVLYKHSEWFRTILEPDQTIPEIQLAENLYNPITNRIVSPSYLADMLHCLYVNDKLDISEFELPNWQPTRRLSPATGGIYSQQIKYDFANSAFLFHYFQCEQEDRLANCLSDEDAADLIKNNPILWTILSCIDRFQYNEDASAAILSIVGLDFVKLGTLSKTHQEEYNKHWPNLSNKFKIEILERAVREYHRKIKF